MTVLKFPLQKKDIPETQKADMILFKIVENNKYLFLFEGKFRAYIVDKSTIKNDEIELLRAKLFEVIPSDKYIICKGW